MKVSVNKTSLRGILRWVQRGLFAGALTMLGYCAFVLGDTWIFQHREQQNLDRLLHAESPATQERPAAGGSPKPAPSVPSIGPEGLIGRIEILRLGVSLIVVEGTDKPTLRRAAGHIVGTAMPGQPGNIGIAAHRDTFFRPLRNIQNGDVITLTTLRGEYHYRVVSTKIVSPYEVAVLNPDDGSQILTLITCYPFYYVGSAPERFIVRADRVI